MNCVSSVPGLVALARESHAINVSKIDGTTPPYLVNLEVAYSDLARCLEQYRSETTTELTARLGVLGAFSFDHLAAFHVIHPNSLTTRLRSNEGYMEENAHHWIDLAVPTISPKAPASSDLRGRTGVLNAVSDQVDLSVAAVLKGEVLNLPVAREQRLAQRLRETLQREEDAISISDSSDEEFDLVGEQPTATIVPRLRSNLLVTAATAPRPRALLESMMSAAATAAKADIRKPILNTRELAEPPPPTAGGRDFEKELRQMTDRLAVLEQHSASGSSRAGTLASSSFVSLPANVTTLFELTSKLLAAKDCWGISLQSSDSFLCGYHSLHSRHYTGLGLPAAHQSIMYSSMIEPSFTSMYSTSQLQAYTGHGRLEDALLSGTEYSLVAPLASKTHLYGTRARSFLLAAAGLARLDYSLNPAAANSAALRWSILVMVGQITMFLGLDAILARVRDLPELSFDELYRLKLRIMKTLFSLSPRDYQSHSEEQRFRLGLLTEGLHDPAAYEDGKCPEQRTSLSTRIVAEVTELVLKSSYLMGRGGIVSPASSTLYSGPTAAQIESMVQSAVAKQNRAPPVPVVKAPAQAVPAGGATCSVCNGPTKTCGGYGRSGYLCEKPIHAGVVCGRAECTSQNHIRYGPRAIACSDGFIAPNHGAAYKPFAKRQ